MINKNDLRYIKTERLIEETYLSLKNKTNASIKVNDLCEAALINKTTFYAHYENMASLHNYICEKTISRILESCPHIEDAFADTSAFVYSLMKVFSENETVLKSLFGQDDNFIINKVEEYLLKLYLRNNESKETEMQIMFSIGGASRLMIKSHDADRAQMTISLLKKLF